MNLGRDRLATNGIIGAYHSFSNAVALDPGHQVANFFLAATKILSVPQRPIEGGFLDRLYVDAAGRDIREWMALIASDTNGLPYAPEGLNGEEFRLMLRTNLLAELQGAEALLSNVTDPGFLVTLTSNETRSAGVTLDYGDVLILRAMCKGVEYSSYTASGLNLDADLAALRTLLTNNQLTVESLLADHPLLFTFFTTNDFSSARQAFIEAVDLYMAGSEIIRQRQAGLVRLFNLQESDMEEEAAFRDNLRDLTNSLWAPTVLSRDPRYSVHLARQFDGSLNLRSLLPAFKGDAFVLGTLPDLTFNGILVNGLDHWQAEKWLNERVSSIPALGPMGILANDMMRLAFFVKPGRGYVVGESINLKDWTPAGSFMAITNREFFDLAMNGAPGKFYMLADTTEFMPPAPNDDFANRTQVTTMNQPYRGYTAGATGEAFEENLDLWDAFHSVWYSWVSPISGEVSIILRGSTGYLTLDLFQGTAPANLTSVWSEENWFNNRSLGGVYNVTAGTTYQIRISSWWEDSGYELVLSRAPVLNLVSPADDLRVPSGTPIAFSGTASDPDSQIEKITIEGIPGFDVQFSQSPFTWTWTNTTPGDFWITVEAQDEWGATVQQGRSVSIAPQNDDFEYANLLAGTAVSVTNVWSGASKQEGEPDHAGVAGTRSLWWRWTPATSGPVSVLCRFKITNWAYIDQYAVAIYKARFSLPVAGEESPFESLCASFLAEAGQTYYIATDLNDEWFEAEGTVSLQIIPTSAPSVAITSPTNDATYTYPAIVLLQASADDSDGTIQTVQFFANDDLLAEVTQPPYEFLWPLPNEEGGTYINAVAIDNSGAFSRDAVYIDIKMPAPPNDDFADRVTLAGNPATANGQNIGATLELFEPTHYNGYGTKSVWYSWQAPAAGIATVTTQGSTFDTILAVYKGTTLETLTRVVQGDDDPDTWDVTATVQFQAEAGVVYQIAVCGFGGATGNIALRVSQP